MWEVIPFPVQNNIPVTTWELDAHFESEIEAADAIQEEIIKYRNIIERTFPTWFMSPGEVIEFLESVRDDVEDEKAA